MRGLFSLIQEKHVGNNSDLITEEIVAIVDILLEYKCISKQQQKEILINWAQRKSKYKYSYNCTYTCFFSFQKFKPNEKFEINRNTLKYDYIRYSPSKTSTINTPNSQIYFNIPREDSVNSLLNSYLVLNFDVLQSATVNRFVENNDIRLVNLGPMALFSNYRLTTSSGRRLEDINHAHNVSLMYKLLTWSRGSDDLNIGFDCSRDRRQRELTNNKNIKCKFLLRI